MQDKKTNNNKKKTRKKQPTVFLSTEPFFTPCIPRVRCQLPIAGSSQLPPNLPPSQPPPQSPSAPTAMICGARRGRESRAGKLGTSRGAARGGRQVRARRERPPGTPHAPLPSPRKRKWVSRGTGSHSVFPVRRRARAGRGSLRCSHERPRVHRHHGRGPGPLSGGGPAELRAGAGRPGRGAGGGRAAVCPRRAPAPQEPGLGLGGGPGPGTALSCGGAALPAQRRSSGGKERVKENPNSERRLVLVLPLEELPPPSCFALWSLQQCFLKK